MSINWSNLSNKFPQGGVIANLPSSGGGDGGIGDIFSGLSSLVNGIKNYSNSNASSSQVINSTQYSGTGQNTLNQQLRVNGQSGLGGYLNKNTQLGNHTSLFESALNQVGLKEGNPILTSYLQKANPNLDPTATPWCAGFVGSVLNASGLKGTGSLAAKSYLNYGNPTSTPSRGDIAVFNDLSGNNDPNHGHVGFVDSIDAQRGVVRVLGGNQSNSVSIKEYPLNKIAGFRQPPTGQAVQQFAAQNNIQNPVQLSNITKRPEQLDQVMSAIAQNETGGAKNPYVSITPSKQGRALGKYQVMDFNVPSWTTEALGHPMTTQQFLNSPEAQEAVAKYKINQYVEKYGPSGAARAWFGGEGSVDKGGNRKDKFGTSVDDYEKKFNQNLLNMRAGYTLADPGDGMPVRNPLDRPQPMSVPHSYAPGLPPLQTASITRIDDVNSRLTQPTYSRTPILDPADDSNQTVWDGDNRESTDIYSNRLTSNINWQLLTKIFGSKLT